jgi:hypothetical protein
VPPARQVPQRTNAAPESELGPESSAVDAALQAWRRKAGDILLAVVAAAHLPVIVLGVLGHGPQMGLLPKAVGVAVYLVAAAAALLRWVDYRRACGPP